MRIGLFGGTFDPIHVGHLVLATVAMEEGHLDRVIFMPAGIPPHKEGKDMAQAEHRLEMVKLATQREPRFEISDWELNKGDISYTIDTVRWLRQGYPQDELFFIVGADMLYDFPNWHQAEQILQIVTILAVPRPGFQRESDQMQQVWGQFPPAFRDRMRILDAPEMEIASTWIRSRIQSGKSIHYLVPLLVEEYILSHQLYGYRSSPEQERLAIDWPELEQQVRLSARQELSPYRFKHVEGVAETADLLAKHYGVSVEKIRVAAWLHDLAREWPKEKLHAEGKRLGIEHWFFSAAELLHGPIAAKLANERFGIYDEEIAAAVKYHTCGRTGMSKFEKVLCLADAIEPGRDYPGVDEVRALAYIHLEKALAVQFDGTIAHLIQRKKHIFVNTLLARNEWWEEIRKLESVSDRTNGNNSIVST